MSKILAIAWKDLRSTLRNVPALVMMLVAPLALAALLGFAFGGGERRSTSPRPRSWWRTPDKGGGRRPARTPAPPIQSSILTSTDLKDSSTSRKTARPPPRRARPSTTARRRWPSSSRADFSAVVYGSDPAATQPRSSSTRTRRRRSAAPSSRASSGRRCSTSTAPARPPPAPSRLRADGGRRPRRPRRSPARRRDVHPRRRRRRPALAASPSARQRPATSASKDVGVTGPILAGMMVFFMFFGAANVARTILDRGPRRHPAAPVHHADAAHGTILGGKFARVFLTVLVQAVVLLVAGRLIFGIDWGRLDAVVAAHPGRPPAWPAASRCSSSRSRETPAQAGAIGAGVYLVLALLGGNFTGTAPDRHAPTPSSSSSRPTAGCCRAGTRRCAAAALADIALAACSCRSAFAVVVLRRRRAAHAEAVRVRLAASGPRRARTCCETRRDRLSFIFILVMPLAFTLFFGLLFGGGSSTDKLPLAVWDADGGAAGEAARRRARASPPSCASWPMSGGRVRDADGRRARPPPACSSRPATAPPWPPASRPTLTIVRDPGLERRADGRQRGALARRRAGRRSSWRRARPPRRSGRARACPAGAQDAGDRGSAAQARPVVAAGARPSRPRAPRSSRPAPPPARSPSGFVLSSPGMMVNFILFSLMTAGIALIVERQNGTLQRLMTTRAAALGAHRRQGGGHVRAHLRAADPPDRRRRSSSSAWTTCATRRRCW